MGESYGRFFFFIRPRLPSTARSSEPWCVVLPLPLHNLVSCSSYNLTSLMLNVFFTISGLTTFLVSRSFSVDPTCQSSLNLSNHIPLRGRSIRCSQPFHMLLSAKLLDRVLEIGGG